LYKPLDETAPPSDEGPVSNAVEGNTVGIEPMPSGATVDDLMARIGQLTDTACSALGWIGDAGVCATLMSHVEAARGGLAQGNGVIAQAAFADLLAELDFQHDTTDTLPVGANAYWLLRVNAEFVLSLIAPESQPTTLGVTADTYLRAGNPNQNQGSAMVLRVRPDGDNRSLLRFDQAALAAAVGSGTVTAARLELTIVENFDNWGPSGRPVDLHRLTQAWTELGATWNCGADLEPGDPTPDCPTTAWAMSGPGARPWVATPTATVTLTNGMRGVVAFDVTADVQAFLSGAANVGWLVKRTDEGPSGAVDFGARESGTPPRLVLQVQ
jgi:hypothetical protein